MITPVDQKTGAAMGWTVRKNIKWAAGDVIACEGANSLWNSLVWIAPKQNMIIIIAANQGGPEAEKAVLELADELGKIFGAK